MKLLTQRTSIFPPSGVNYHDVGPVIIGRLKIQAVESLDKAIKAKRDAENEIDRCKNILDRLEQDPDRFIYLTDWLNATSITYETSI